MLPAGKEGRTARDVSNRDPGAWARVRMSSLSPKQASQIPGKWTSLQPALGFLFFIHRASTPRELERDFSRGCGMTEQGGMASNCPRSGLD